MTMVTKPSSPALVKSTSSSSSSPSSSSSISSSVLMTSTSSSSQSTNGSSNSGSSSNSGHASCGNSHRHHHHHTTTTTTTSVTSEKTSYGPPPPPTHPHASAHHAYSHHVGHHHPGGSIKCEVKVEGFLFGNENAHELVQKLEKMNGKHHLHSPGSSSPFSSSGSSISSVAPSASSVSATLKARVTSAALKSATTAVAAKDAALKRSKSLPPTGANTTSSASSSSAASVIPSAKSLTKSLSMLLDNDQQPAHLCQCQPTPTESREFRKRWMLLSDSERKRSLRGAANQFLHTTSDLLPCLGCRTATENLFIRMTEGSCSPSPLIVSNGICFDKAAKAYRLSDLHVSNPDACLALFLHQERWGNASLALKNGKTSKQPNRIRCPLHSQRSRGRPRPAAFEALWKKLPEEHQRHLSHIDSDQFLTDLECYLRRHRFCCRCKEKVLEAYDLLIGSSCSEDDCEDCAAFGECGSDRPLHDPSEYGDDLHYTSYLFDELTYSRATSHIIVPCHLDFMTQLMTRADQEVVGDWGDRHARTIAEAQDEVLTCLGMVIWDKMQNLWTKSRVEKRSEELLVHCIVSTLRRNFDMAVEALHGKEMMEQLLAEEDDESRRLAKKKEKRKEKKKKRKTASKLKQAAQAAASSSSSPAPKQQPKGSKSSLKNAKSQSTQDDDADADEDDDHLDNQEASSPTHSNPNSTCSTNAEEDRDGDNQEEEMATKLDERKEMKLLSSMGWDGHKRTSRLQLDVDAKLLRSSSPFSLDLLKMEQLGFEDDDDDDEDNQGIPEDEIRFWKQNQSSLVSKRLAQREKLQQKFDEFVRNNC